MILKQSSTRSARATAGDDLTPLADGDTVQLGAVQLEIVETPAGSPESMPLLLVHERDSAPGRPHALRNGDTLFIGARPRSRSGGRATPAGRAWAGLGRVADLVGGLGAWDASAAPGPRAAA